MDKIAFRFFIFIMSSGFFNGLFLITGSVNWFLFIFSSIIGILCAYIVSELFEIEYPGFFLEEGEVEKYVPSPPSHVRVASAMSLAESTSDEDETEQRRIAEDLADFDRRLRQGGA